MEDSNKLIAKFMGYYERIKNPDGRLITTYKSPIDGYNMKVEDMLFEYSWDWIIPVIKLIHMEEQSVFYNDTFVIDNLEVAMIHLDINEVYKAVIGFIEYYNTTK